MNKDDLNWWLELAPSLSWRFAKTMTDWPHSYVVRGQMLDDEDFTRAVQVIRTFGTPQKFFDRTGIYLVDGDVKWWTMGEPIGECEIINTAKASEVYGTQDAPSTATHDFTVYDSLATVYDNRYTHPSDIAENEAMRKLIMRHFGAYAPTVLDVGCGTGLLLDLGITAASLYHGIDPSQGMLNELLRKHPKTSNLVPQAMEDALDSFRPGQFEAVLSLFGSPSYIHPDVITALPKLSSDLTVFMHYEAGYLPDYWKNLPRPQHVDASREAAAKLGGTMFKLNHFVVTVCRN